MGLFDKKFCDICGEKIGFLGNRKLEDGNLCKDCASKLSPFFSERRSSTVEEIKRQLAYREENEKKLADFSPSLVFGEERKVYIDTAGERFIVTSRSNWRGGNPDLITFSQVRNVNTEIEENKEEIYFEDSEGNKKSYEPRRYECDYAFNVTIFVDSPWFDEIKLELSDGNRPESPYTDLYRDYEKKMHELADILMRRGGTAAAYSGASAGASVGAASFGAASFDSRPSVSAPAAGQTASGEWTCTSCGARNSGKFCESCGAGRPAAFTGCTSCGWRPADGQSAPKFCPECGTPLSR